MMIEIQKAFNPGFNYLIDTFVNMALKNHFINPSKSETSIIDRAFKKAHGEVQKVHASYIIRACIFNAVTVVGITSTVLVIISLANPLLFPPLLAAIQLGTMLLLRELIHRNIHQTIAGAIMDDPSSMGSLFKKMAL